MISLGARSSVLDQNGQLRGGLVNAGGRWYLADRTGQILKTNRWERFGSEYYFPTLQGPLYVSRLLSFGRSVYAVDETGRRVKNQTLWLGKTLYAFGSDGLQRRDNTWVNIGPGRVFVRSDGRVYANQILSFGRTSYFVDAQGYQSVGIQSYNGALYLFDPVTKAMRKDNTWVHYGDHDYFPRSDGRLYRNQFLSFGSKLQYYVGEDGRRMTGLQTVNGRTYQFDADGRLIATKAYVVVDLSQWQDPDAINFDAFVKNIDGVILRVGFTGYGTGSSYYADSKFERFYQEFKKRGIPVGAYWYSCADTVPEGRAEAEFMLRSLRGKQFELPIYWDTEDEHHQRYVSKKQLTDTGLAFLQRLEQEGYYTGIYASAYWLRDRLDLSRLTNYQIWVAHYGVEKPMCDRYGMWQYTESGRLNGYSGALDLNFMYTDYPSIIKRLGKNGF